MKVKNKTNLIFLHKTLKAIADSVVKVFIPLLIFKSSNNMLLVMLYLCSYFPLCSILNFVLKKFLQKYGVIAIVLHAIPLIASQFLLNLNITWWLCLIMALLMALSQALYAVPLNILFSFTDKNVNVAKFQIATNVGKIIFILLSGYILSSSITNSLLIMTISCSIIYIISALPLIFGYKVLKEAYENAAVSSNNLDKKSYRLFNLYHVQFGIFQIILDDVLPLFLYVENLTFQSVAIVMVLIEVCRIGANLLAKYLISKNLSILSVIVSLVIMFASCIVVIFVRNALVLYIFSCCIGISFPLLFVPLFSAYVKKLLRDNNQFDGMTFRDVYIFSCRDILFIPYFIFPNFIVQFVLGIVCTLSLGYTTTKILKTEETVEKVKPQQEEIKEE